MGASGRRAGLARFLRQGAALCHSLKQRSPNTVRELCAPRTFASTSQCTELHSLLLFVTFESLFWPHELSDFSPLFQAF